MRSTLGRTGLLAVAGLTALAASAPLAWGQNEGQDGKQPEIAARITVDFKGGFLKEYVTSLRNSVRNEPVNIVLSGEADLELPSITLKGVAVEAAVALLEHLELADGKISVSSTPQAGAAPVFVIRSYRSVRVASSGKPANDGAGDLDLAVFSLRSLLEVPPGTPEAPGAKSDATSLLTAVQTALTMGGGNRDPEMKFHPESGVLVIRGSHEQTGAVQRLIGAMQGDMDRYRSAAGHSRAKESELEANLARAQVDMQAAASEVEFAITEFEQAELLAKEGHVSAGDVARAKLAIDQRRANVSRAKIAVDLSVQQLEVWRDGTRASPRGGQMTPDQLRQKIKEVEGTLNSLRAELKKMETTGTR
ncbi:MAG: hypothetical protein ACKVU4_12115 [Phycisphaerales bacterium]